MSVLALDASTYVGSVALIRDGAVVAEATAAMRGEREERLMPAISEILSRHAVPLEQLTAIACGAGPGSFTSLRIAASIAKGLCTAQRIPLVVTPSALLVLAAAGQDLVPGKYVVAMDAMRGDFFWQDVDVRDDGRLQPGMASRTSRVELDRHASARQARIVGPSESPPMRPHARGFARLMADGIAVEVALTTWEPTYGRKAEAQVKWEAAHGRELEPS